MVEGHSVHRVATRMHHLGLIGKRFVAVSPNGRFTDGAAAISNQIFYDVQAIGKNLFAFFGTAEAPTVVHIHFGMAGVWAIFQASEEVPEPTKTNRLRLVNAEAKITADLSAMTVQYGGIELYNEKRNALGSDPLRGDADPEGLWTRISGSKKSIGSLIMDQSYFAGPGNIYRAEILFKAGIHPDTPGNELEWHQFNDVWKHTVDLMRRGYTTGSILTVDPDEAFRLGRPGLRRYIYNAKRCPRCQSTIQTWPIQNRTCYACLTCQPPWNKLKATVSHEPFRSHCAPEPSVALSNMTVEELKAYLTGCNIDFPKSSRKRDLVDLATQSLDASPPAVVTPPRVTVSAEDATIENGGVGENLAVEPIRSHGSLSKPSVAPSNMTVVQLKAYLTDCNINFPKSSRKRHLVELATQSLDSSPHATVVTPPRLAMVSAEDAALEKGAAGESLAVEHIAELAPSQARRARKRAKQ